MNKVVSLESARQDTSIKACHMSLYPTKDSLLEAVECIESQEPYTKEDLFPLLMMYHNTLIKIMTEK